MRNPLQNVNLYRQTGITVFIMLIAVAAVGSAVDVKAEKADGTHTAKHHAGSLLRDPFWPVGYRPKRELITATNGPQASVEQDVSTDWNKAMQEIAIQGVSSRAGNEFYAVINGEVKGKDDTVSVQVGSTVYTWKIEDISPPSSVKMRRVSVKPEESLYSNEKEGNGYDD